MVGVARGGGLTCLRRRDFEEGRTPVEFEVSVRHRLQ